MTYPSATPAANSGVTRHNLHHGRRQTRHTWRPSMTSPNSRSTPSCSLALPLKNTPDPAGGSMLDSTVIVYIGDNGELRAPLHRHRSFPVVLIGGSAGTEEPAGAMIVHPGRRYRRLGIIVRCPTCGRRWVACGATPDAGWQDEGGLQTSLAAKTGTDRARSAFPSCCLSASGVPVRWR